MNPLELADPPPLRPRPGRPAMARPRRWARVADFALRAAAGLALLQLIGALTAYVLSQS